MKSIMAYISCIVFALAYTYFMDGKNGIIMLFVLIVSAIISISLTVIAKNMVEISVESSAHVINKREKVVLSAIFKKRGIIPVPFIKVCFFNTQNFITIPSKYVLAINTKKPVKIEQSYIARIWGVAQIGIEEVAVSDYLGLVRFVLYKDSGADDFTKVIEICPNIPDVSAVNELAHSICDAVAYEDHEETKENIITVSGVPGYEHKHYTPGDSIKKINWKLSAKRNVLMVRLDEAIINSKQVLVLDCCNKQVNLSKPDEELKQLVQDERIIEAVLALLTNLVKQGIESSFYYFTGKAWAKVDVSGVNDLGILQYKLAKYKFVPQTNGVVLPRVPLSIITEQSEVSVITIFTSNFDEDLYGQIQNMKHRGITAHTVVTEPTRLAAENVWLVNDSYEFISMREERND
jgi:hypothetical protein